MNILTTNEVAIHSLVRSALGLSALMSTTLAAEAPANATGWKSSAFAGVTLTRGNSESMMVNANLTTEKKWAKNELAFGAGATYGEADEKVNASNLNAFGQYNRLFTERLYGYARVDGLHDDIADVAYRVTLSPGAGYYFIKNDKFTLSGEVGPGFVFEKLAGVESRYITLRLGERFTWKINDHSRLWQTFDYMPKVDQWDDYVANAEIGVETDITKSLGLRVVGQDTYRSCPAAGREENDVKLFAGLTYKF